MSGIWSGSRVTATWPTAPSPRRSRVAGEPAGLPAGHRNGPDGLVVTEQRHNNPASVATGAGVGTHGFGHSRIGLGVGDIDRRSIAHGLGVRPGGLVRLWEDRPRGSIASVIGARERGQHDLITRDPGD